MKKEKPQKLIEEWAQEYSLLPSEEVEQLQNMAVFHTNMEEFLENLLLGQEGDIMRSGGKEYLSDTVHLMTLHGSKGLEISRGIFMRDKRGGNPSGEARSSR